MRQRLHSLWILVTLGYAGLRILLANQFLAKYGLNTGWFAVIELSSSLLLGFASGHFVHAAIDRRMRAAKGWLALTVIGYAAPDAYVFASTRHLPTGLLVVLIVVVVVSMVATAVGIVRRLRKDAAATRLLEAARRAEAAEAAEAAEVRVRSLAVPATVEGAGVVAEPPTVPTMVEQ